MNLSRQSTLGARSHRHSGSQVTLGRRCLLVAAAVTVTAISWGIAGQQVPAAELRESFDGPARDWIGPRFWANRLQDWRVADGRLECVGHAPRLNWRTVHILTHRPTRQTRQLDLELTVGTLSEGLTPDAELDRDARVGMVMGVGHGEIDFRAAAIMHEHIGRGSGLFVGLDGHGTLALFDLESGQPLPRHRDDPTESVTLPVQLDLRQRVTLQLRVVATEAGGLVSAAAKQGSGLSDHAEWLIPADRWTGNLALAAHPGRGGVGFWFDDVSVSGDTLAVDDRATFGPVVCTQYTLSHNVLTLTAQLAPVPRPTDAKQRVAHWQVLEGDTYQTLETAPVIVPGYTATFRRHDWNATRDVPYRVVYGDPSRSPRETSVDQGTWTGTIRRDPVDKDPLVVAGFTGNHNNIHGMRVGGQIDWIRGMWFPHHDLSRNVAAHRPDLLFFSGDQVYEGNSPSFADTRHIQPDYLYKWYLWCWAYRHLTRDIPTICLPDDHDVYQGNLWGQGGRPSPGRDHEGGYVHPAEFVKMVERTQMSHLPPPFHTETVDQGLAMWHTDVTYGRVSFAVMEDRKFKSGCARSDMPPSRTGRPDHFNDPEFNTGDLDVPGLTLYGPHQLDFLEHWAADWRDADMKMMLSQTTLANLATHHGPQLERLIADLDSNGWPQSGRNRALRVLRKAFAFHLCGDQHLATLVHHGIDEQDDAIWSFCVPSIANFYPRAFAPENAGVYARPTPAKFVGPRRDGFGNLIHVVAATNPGESTGHEPAELHDRMPGYGIVRVNRSQRTYTAECWPRYADPEKDAGGQYPGWPRTIAQQENYASRIVGYLPEIVCQGITDPVMQVRKADTGELIYALRVAGQRFRPPVYESGDYIVRVGQPSGSWRELPDLRIEPAGGATTRFVDFTATSTP